MQLVDELNMIYTACLMCYATFSFSQSRVVRQVLGFGLLSLAVFITVCEFISILQADAKGLVSSFTTIIFRTPSSTRMPSLSLPP
jgi:hypothetical protein